MVNPNNFANPNSESGKSEDQIRKENEKYFREAQAGFRKRMEADQASGNLICTCPDCSPHLWQYVDTSKMSFDCVNKRKDDVWKPLEHEATPYIIIGLCGVAFLLILLLIFGVI